MLLLPNTLRKRTSSRALGFTLIEILVVMVIISIVAGVAMVSITSNQSKQYENTAKQLVNLIILAEEEAMLRPATLGLAFSDHAFQFYIYHHNAKTKKNSWRPLKQTALSKHALAKNTVITLKISGVDAPTDGTPQLIISASGDIAPFVISIGKSRARPYYRVIGKANGEVTSEAVQTE